MSVLTDLRNRGVRDVFFVVCDGLKGLPDVVTNVWPQAIVQTCIIHLIRNTFRLSSRRDWDAIKRAIRPIYTAVNAGAARQAFDELADTWGRRYPAITKLWDNAWNEFIPFLDYDIEIRTVLCSTNAIWVFRWSCRSGSSGSLRSAGVTGPDSECDWRVASLISRCRAGRFDGGVGEPGLNGAWQLNPDVPVPRPRCHHRRSTTGGSPWNRFGVSQASTRTSTTSPQASSMDVACVVTSPRSR